MKRQEIIRHGTDFSIYNNPPLWAIPPKDMVYIDDNGISYWTKQNRFYETHIMKVFLDYIKKEPEVILDIGGNIGNHSLMFHQLYAKSKIFSFEASPYNFVYLYQNVNNIENIFPYCIGLSDKREIVDFNHYEEDFGSSGVASYQTEKKDNKNPSFEMSILLEKFDSLGFDDIPDLIKIDVENYEVNVLKGMSNLLDNMKKDSYIWVEDHLLEAAVKSEKDDEGKIMDSNGGISIVNSESWTVILEKENSKLKDSPSTYLIKNHNFEPVSMVECNLLLKKI